MNSITQDPQLLLQQYCDINDIPYHSSWSAVVNYFVDHPTHLISYRTPYAWLFHQLHLVILGQSDQEEFITMGDTYNPVRNTTSFDQPHPQCVVVDHSAPLPTSQNNTNIIIIL